MTLKIRSLPTFFSKLNFAAMTLQKKKKIVYDWFLKYFTRPQSVPDSQLFKNVDETAKVARCHKIGERDLELRE